MANETNPFGDFTKMIQQFKVPGFDVAPIIESRRKDMEALVQANKAAYEGMQALARKQTEILTHTPYRASRNPPNAWPSAAPARRTLPSRRATPTKRRSPT